jgi:hypothetical protein
MKLNLIDIDFLRTKWQKVHTREGQILLLEADKQWTPVVWN